MVHRLFQPAAPGWIPAPEVGAGVYKRATTPDVVLWNGGQVLRIHDDIMGGDTVKTFEGGFSVLDYPADLTWIPLPLAVLSVFLIMGTY